MKNKISQLPYLNKIKDCVTGVDPKELLILYTDLQDNNVIAPIASGRSKCVMNVPVSQLALMKDSKTIIDTEGPGFPWGSIYRAASTLEEMYKKVLLLFNTGSGTTPDSLNFARDIARYIDETNSKKFTVDVITSSPKAPIANIGRKYGHVLEIKDPEKKKKLKKKGNKFSETGIMRDVHELSSGFILQILTLGLYSKVAPADIYNFFIEESEKEIIDIGHLVDACVESPFYSSAIDALERRSNIFRNSKGSGDEVVKVTLRRLSHVKQAVGEQVYITNPPHPRAGDVQFSVSYSGTTRSVVNNANLFRGHGGYQFSVVSKEKSHLSKISDSFTIIEEMTKKWKPRKFYMRAAFVLSPLPIKLIERFDEREIKLDPSILAYYHSVTE